MVRELKEERGGGKGVGDEGGRCGRWPQVGDEGGR